MDSAIFHAFSQRYDKKLLLEMLNAEVDKLTTKIGDAKLVRWCLPPDLSSIETSHG